MAVTTGNDYDHIDIAHGDNATRHFLKDSKAREDLVVQQAAQPSSDVNKIWFPSTIADEVAVPTEAEHEALAQEVNSLKSASSAVGETEKHSQKGQSTLAIFAEFVNGSLSGGNVTVGTNLWRVATDTKISFDYAITLKAKDGYRFLLNIFSGSSYTSTNWQTEYTAAANSEWKICIAKVTEDTSTVANIQEFVSTVTFDTFIRQEITALDQHMDDVDGELDKVFVEMPMTKIYNGLTVFNGYPGSDGSFTSSDSFKTYLFQLPETREIYFTDYAVTNPYTSVCVYSSSTISSENLIGTRLRYNSSDNTIPTSTNKLTVNGGNYIAVSVRDGADFKLWGTHLITPGLVSTVDISGNLENQSVLIKNLSGNYANYLRYYSGASSSDHYSGLLYVYLYNGFGYTLYLFTHTVYQDRNADVWRVHNAYLTDMQLENSQLISTDGEWECAIKISGAQDFMGGLAHGDETVEDITFFVDGKPVDITGFTTVTAFSELKIYQKSTLYHPGSSDSDPIKGTAVAEHNSIHTFANGKVIVDQTIKWLENESLDNSYLAMLPASKNVTEKLLVNTDAEKLTLSTYPVDFSKVRMAMLYGDAVSFEFNINRYPLGQDNGADFRVHDNGGNNYNKCYYYVTKAGLSQSATAGDIWVAQSEYIITAHNAN